MARARNIKPGFFKNEELVLLDPHYRLLFIGLWMMADRDGILEDRSMRIKIEIFPVENIDVERGLSELHKSKLIVRYVVSNKRLIYIPTFSSHQNPHQNEKSLGFEKPDKDFLEKFFVSESGIPLNESLLMNHESLLSALGTKTDTSTGVAPESSSAVNTPKRKSDDPKFVPFWESYPKRNGKRVGKDAAYKAWRQIPVEDHPELLKAIENYQSCDFIRDMQRFLKENYWREWVDGKQETEEPKQTSLLEQWQERV